MTSSGRRLRQALLYAIYGGVAIWSADIAIQSLSGTMTAGRMTLRLGWSLPIVALCAYAMARIVGRDGVERPAIALFMITGVWVLGPTMIWVGQKVQEGGPGEWWEPAGVMLLTVGFPVFLPVMCIWDKSILGLAGVTLTMAMVYALLERRCWVLPWVDVTQRTTP